MLSRDGMHTKLDILGVVSEAARVCRSEWTLVVLLAAVVFLPIALLDAWKVTIDTTEGHISPWVVSADVLRVLVNIALATLGAQFYAGVVERVVAKEHAGHRMPGVADVLRSVPYGRLVITDILLTALLMVGLVLLVVPGILVLVFFSVTAPLVSEEGHVLKAMRRSVRLVRLSPWRAGAIVIGSALLVSGAGNGIESLFGRFEAGYLADFLGAYIGAVVTEPLGALAIVVMMFHLLDIEETTRGKSTEKADP